MTDLEFDLIDEMYFVTAFEVLQSKVQAEEQALQEALEGLLQKGWVKCFLPQSDEIVTSFEDFSRHYKNYHYLASKEGLLAHNSR